jgi:hypothetical protein
MKMRQLVSGCSGAPPVEICGGLWTLLWVSMFQMFQDAPKVAFTWLIEIYLRYLKLLEAS